MLDIDHIPSMNVLVVLGVLMKHSSKEKPIRSQAEIQRLAYADYGVSIDTKTIGRNLRALEAFLIHADLGYKLRYHGTSTRKKKGGEEEELNYNWFLKRDLTRGEINALLNGMLYSKYIPLSSCMKLLKKLNNLIGPDSVKISKVLPDKSKNDEFIYNVDLLSKATEIQKKVSFKFLEYGTDISNKPRIITDDDDGEEHVYIVSPYEVVANNGKHYLLCAHNIGDDLFNYRVDYIRELKYILKNEKGKDEEANYVNNRPITDFTMNWDKFLEKYMREHLYMFNGISKEVTLCAYKMRVGKYGKTIDTDIVSHIRDWFGDNVIFMNETETTVLANVTVNVNAMLYWALQYGQSVEILKPSDLREAIASTVQGMHDRYCIPVDQKSDTAGNTP